MEDVRVVCVFVPLGAIYEEARKTRSWLTTETRRIMGGSFTLTEFLEQLAIQKVPKARKIDSRIGGNFRFWDCIAFNVMPFNLVEVIRGGMLVKKAFL